jgi:hypothetical protein
MTPSGGFVQLLYAAVIAGEAAVLLKLWRHRLAAIYPLFTLFISFQFLRSLTLIQVSPRSNLFGWIWIPTEILTWVLCYLVVFEIYSKVLDDYPGIRRATRLVLSVALGVCLSLAAATLWVDIAHGVEKFPILGAVNVVRRWAASTLTLFLLLMLGYLAWYPAPLKRNLIVHAVLNALYCIAISVGVFYRNILGPDLARTLSLALGAVTVLILAGWAALMTRGGEERMSSGGRLWGSRDQRRVLAQLAAINRALARQ